MCLLLNGSEHKHKPVGHLNGVQRREALLLAHSQSFHWSAPASCLSYRPAVLLCTSAPNPLTVWHRARWSVGSRKWASSGRWSGLDEGHLGSTILSSGGVRVGGWAPLKTHTKVLNIRCSPNEHRRVSLFSNSFHVFTCIFYFFFTWSEVIESGDSSDELAAEAWACTVDILQGGHRAWDHTAVIIYQHLRQAYAVHTMGSLHSTNIIRSLRLVHPKYRDTYMQSFLDTSGPDSVRRKT